MTLFPPHLITYSTWIALHIYCKGIARREWNWSSKMMVRLTHNWQGGIYRSAQPVQRRVIKKRGLSGRHIFTFGSRRSAFSHLFWPVFHTWSTPLGPCWKINLQLNTSMEPCQGFMKISRQGGLPFSTGRSFKWLWLAWSASLSELSLTSALVSNDSYQRPLWIWFGSTPTAQVMMPMMMCQNTLV